MLACGNKRLGRRLLQSIGKFANAASTGQLPAEARFILDSRLVFLRKKRGVVPRPIRVGELWRRVVAKRLLFEHQADIVTMCKDARQFGVGFPGGADVLIHFRILLEKLRRSENVSDVMALIYSDFKNAFRSIEWDALRSAIEEVLPQLLDWCKWCHMTPATINLPSRGNITCDRGVEHGDPLGPVYCAAVLVLVWHHVRNRLDDDGIILAAV